jgi:hypothetical protein
MNEPWMWGAIGVGVGITLEWIGRGKALRQQYDLALTHVDLACSLDRLRSLQTGRPLLPLSEIIDHLRKVNT